MATANEDLLAQLRQKLTAYVLAMAPGASQAPSLTGNLFPGKPHFPPYDILPKTGTPPGTPAAAPTPATTTPRDVRPRDPETILPRIVAPSMHDIRRQVLERGGGSPYGASATVEQSGRTNNPAQTARAVDTHRRGTADLTLGNLMRAGGMMMNLAGPFGAFKTGLSMLRNPDPYTGSVPGTAWGKKMVADGVPARDVQRLERHAARGGTMGGRGEQRGPGGGHGGSYGENDPTSKGPGGTLGHI